MGGHRISKLWLGARRAAESTYERHTILRRLWQVAERDSQQLAWPEASKRLVPSGRPAPRNRCSGCDSPLATCGHQAAPRQTTGLSLTTCARITGSPGAASDTVLQLSPQGKACALNYDLPGRLDLIVGRSEPASDTSMRRLCTGLDCTRPSQICPDASMQSMGPTHADPCPTRALPGCQDTVTTQLWAAPALFRTRYCAGSARG